MNTVYSSKAINWAFSSQREQKWISFFGSQRCRLVSSDRRKQDWWIGFPKKPFLCSIKRLHLSPQKKTHIWTQHNRTNKFQQLFYGTLKPFFGTPDTHLFNGPINTIMNFSFSSNNVHGMWMSSWMYRVSSKTCPKKIFFLVVLYPNIPSTVFLFGFFFLLNFQKQLTVDYFTPNSRYNVFQRTEQFCTLYQKCFISRFLNCIIV